MVTYGWPPKRITILLYKQLVFPLPLLFQEVSVFFPLYRDVRVRCEPRPVLIWFSALRIFLVSSRILIRSPKWLGRTTPRGARIHAFLGFHH